MGFKTMSIRFLISASFVILMVITLIAISTIIFTSWDKSSDSIIEKMENDASKDIVNEIDNLLHVPTNINEMNQKIIENEMLDLTDKEVRDIYFASILQSSDSEIYSFKYGLENGDFYGARRNADDDIEIYRSTGDTNGHSFYYSTNEDLTEDEFIGDFGEFDPRTRDWYQLAKAAGKPIFTPPYNHFVKNDLVISSNYPIYNKEGILQGVLGTNITMTSLNHFLEEVLADELATALVIDRVTGDS